MKKEDTKDFKSLVAIPFGKYRKANKTAIKIIEMPTTFLHPSA
ncbi:hypothetical protein [Ferruginibacter sp.]